MSTPVCTVDDYTLSLIEHDIVRFFPGLVNKGESVEEAPEETKVVRPRGRRPAKGSNVAVTK